MSRYITFTCPECHSSAKVTKKDVLNARYTRLYCTCKNPHCGAKWVMSAEFSHFVKNTKYTQQGFLHYLLKKLPPEELKNLQAVINSQLPP